MIEPVEAIFVEVCETPEKVDESRTKLDDKVKVIKNAVNEFSMPQGPAFINGQWYL